MRDLDSSRCICGTAIPAGSILFTFAGRKRGGVSVNSRGRLLDFPKSSMLPKARRVSTGGPTRWRGGVPAATFLDRFTGGCCAPVQNAPKMEEFKSSPVDVRLDRGRDRERDRDRDPDRDRDSRRALNPTGLLVPSPRARVILERRTPSGSFAHMMLLRVCGVCVQARGRVCARVWFVKGGGKLTDYRCARAACACVCFGTDSRLPCPARSHPLFAVQKNNKPSRPNLLHVWGGGERCFKPPWTLGLRGATTYGRTITVARVARTVALGPMMQHGPRPGPRP